MSAPENLGPEAPPEQQPQPAEQQGLDPTATAMAGVLRGTVAGDIMTRLAERLARLPEAKREALVASTPGLGEALGASAAPKSATETAPSAPAPAQAEPTPILKPQPTKSVVEDPAQDGVFRSAAGKDAALYGTEEGVRAAQERLRQQRAGQLDELSAPLESLDHNERAAQPPARQETQPQGTSSEERHDLVTPQTNPESTSSSYADFARKMDQLTGKGLTDALAQARQGDGALMASWYEGRQTKAAATAGRQHEQTSLAVDDNANERFDFETEGDEIFPYGIGRDKTDPYAASVDVAVAGLRRRRSLLRATARAAQSEPTQPFEASSAQDENVADQGSQWFEPDTDNAPESGTQHTQFEQTNAGDDGDLLGNSSEQPETGETIVETTYEVDPKQKMTEQDLDEIEALPDDEYSEVYKALTRRQKRELHKIARERASRDGYKLERLSPIEWVKLNPTKAAVGALALAAMGVATALIAKDFSFIGHSGGHAAGALPTPTGTPSTAATHAASSAPTPGSGAHSSASAAASSAPTPKGTPTITPSGGHASGPADQLPHGHTGGANVQTPGEPNVGGGHAAAPPSVEHAIQISNAADAAHHSQAVWTSLHEAGFSDNQIGNAIEKATQNGTGSLERVPATGGGFYLRLTSNGSSSPDAVMSVLKNYIS